MVDYAALVTNPTATFYDNAVGNAAPNKVLPSYRMHVHYGTVGAIFAGQGGVQFTGSVTYENSAHTTEASCSDCHMAEITGRAGGHTFKVRSGEGALTSSTTWNFKGCNVTGCHSGNTISSDQHSLDRPQEIKISDLLNTLAVKINAIGGRNKYSSQ